IGAAIALAIKARLPAEEGLEALLQDVLLVLPLLGVAGFLVPAEQPFDTLIEQPATDRVGQVPDVRLGTHLRRRTDDLARDREPAVLLAEEARLLHLADDVGRERR